MEIRIKVENDIATLLTKEPLVCGNSDYKVVFEFDEAWDAYPTKTAMFVFNKQSVSKPFDGNVCEGVSIENATVCAIGVFVGDKKASTGVTVDCLLSIKDDGSVPAPPSKDVYDELIELLNEYIKAAQGAPSGGKSGQVLKKLSNEDYDFGWADDERADLSHYDRWDNVITDVADFTTENLATMSGGVLIKGINAEIDNIEVSVHSGISIIKFVDCKFTSFYGSISGTRATKVVGFVSSNPVDTMTGSAIKLIGFGGIEFCQGSLHLENCYNVIHSRIVTAEDCYNLSDIYCTMNALIYYNQFINCVLISDVLIDKEDDHDNYVEFINCKHISNVHNLHPREGDKIDYINCKFVVGDTCDDYYTENEIGKVQTVTTDGTSAFVAVYSQDEIDGKLGDISSILTALHEGGIE